MRTFWDLYALVYDSLRHLLPYQELMKRTVEALDIQEDGLNVLDAGCGTGNFAEALFHMNACDTRVVGIDASDIMARRAAKKARRLSGFFVSKADLNERLPYEDGTFDHVVCLNTLYALKDPEFTLKELQRVLKLGGRLVVANPKCDPRIRDGFIAHFKAVFSLRLLNSLRSLLKTFSLIPVFTLVVGLNYLIKKKARHREYHFLHLVELADLFERNEFRVLDTDSVYGGTANFVTLTKVRRIDKDNKVLMVEVAQTREDFDAIFRLRYDVYCEEMRSLDPDDYPNRSEQDAHDAYSFHFVLKMDNNVVGTVRLVPDVGDGFLIEEHFPLPSTVERSCMIEVSRLAISRSVRGKATHLVLLDAAADWSREHGYTHWCYATQPDIVRFLRSVGWTMHHFAPAGMCHNYLLIPSIRNLY